MSFANLLSHRPARSARLVAIAGIAAIALILCGVAVLTAINLQKTRDGVDRLSRATQVGDAYSQTTIAVSLASVYADAYRHSGDPQAQQQMFAAIREAFTQVNLAKEKGSPADRTLIASLEARYSSELRNALALLDGTGQYATESDPALLDNIVTAFAQPSADARAKAEQNLAEFRSGFDRRSTAVLAAFLLALPVLALLFWVIMRYERKTPSRPRSYASWARRFSRTV